MDGSRRELSSNLKPNIATDDADTYLDSTFCEETSDSKNDSESSTTSVPVGVADTLTPKVIGSESRLSNHGLELESKEDMSIVSICVDLGNKDEISKLSKKKSTLEKKKSTLENTSFEDELIENSMRKQAFTNRPMPSILDTEDTNEISKRHNKKVKTVDTDLKNSEILQTKKTFKLDQVVESSALCYRVNNTTFYTGKIVAVNADNTYDIEYDDGEIEKYVKIEKIRQVKSTENALNDEGSLESVDFEPLNSSTNGYDISDFSPGVNVLISQGAYEGVTAKVVSSSSIENTVKVNIIALDETLTLPFQSLIPESPTTKPPTTTTTTTTTTDNNDNNNNDNNDNNNNDNNDNNDSNIYNNDFEWNWELQITDTFDVWYYNSVTEVSAWEPPGVTTPMTEGNEDQKNSNVSNILHNKKLNADSEWKKYLQSKFTQQKDFLMKLQSCRNKVQNDLCEWEIMFVREHGNKLPTIDDKRSDKACIALFIGLKKLTSALIGVRDMLMYLKSCKNYIPSEGKWIGSTGYVKDWENNMYDDSYTSYQNEGKNDSLEINTSNATNTMHQMIENESPKSGTERSVAFANVVTQMHTSGEESCSPLHSPTMSPSSNEKRRGPRHLTAIEKESLFALREDLRPEGDLAQKERERRAAGGAIGAAADASKEIRKSSSSKNKVGKNNRYNVTVNNTNNSLQHNNLAPSNSEIVEAKESPVTSNSIKQNSYKIVNTSNNTLPPMPPEVNQLPSPEVSPSTSAPILRRRKRTRKRKGPPRVKDVGRWTHVLFSAVKRGNIETVSKLFDDGCPVDLQHPQSADTALLHACRFGQDNIARICISRGSALDPHPEFGLTALQAALEGNHYNCLIVILDAVAEEARRDTREKHSRENINFNSGVFTSDAQGDKCASETSRDDHSLVDKENEAVRLALEVAVNQQASVQGVGGFPVHIATRNGGAKCLEELLRHNANPELLDAAMRTPAHVAAETDHVECLQLLLQTPEASDVLLEATDHEGCTALHCAARVGSDECVQLLLQTAANPLCANANGKLPQDLAETNGHTRCATMLSTYARDHVDTRRKPATTNLVGDKSKEKSIHKFDITKKLSKFISPKVSEGEHQMKANAASTSVILPENKSAVKSKDSSLKDELFPAPALKKTEKDSGVIRELAEGDACVICRQQPKDTAILPCGHKCVCFSCGNIMLFRSTCVSPRSRKPRCPLCRCNIQTVARIFD